MPPDIGTPKAHSTIASVYRIIFIDTQFAQTISQLPATIKSLLSRLREIIVF